ncbi:MAG: putative peptidoglycan-binding domain-containing protein [Gammaproteobacteria bacterium]
MADFEQPYRATNLRERMVLSNVATDRGGMTYGGIARGRKPGEYWLGWAIVDAVLARSPDGGFFPTEAETAKLHEFHREFFRRYFWDDLNGSIIPDQEYADKLYDAAVNCSRTSVVGWLQSALNVANLGGTLWPDIVIDGQLGAKTADAIFASLKHPERRWLVFQVLETQQEYHYYRLALRDPSQEINLYGWYRHRIQHRTEPPRR